METTMNNIHPDTTTPAAEAPQPHAPSRPGRRAGRPGDDVVRWAEFRQMQWVMSVALAVIISGQGLLYSAILDLQGQIGNLQGEMGVLRADLQTQISNLSADTQTQISNLSADTQTQISDLRTDLQTQINELRIDMQTQFSELRERIVRIETHLGIEAGSDM